MSIYCLCQATTGLHAGLRDSMHDNQVYDAPNRLGPDIEGGRPVFLRTPMKVIQIGVEQRVMEGSECVPSQRWLSTEKKAVENKILLECSRRHHPNVDILQCTHCGAMIVRE